MSEYREKLQNMMLRADATGIPQPQAARKAGALAGVRVPPTARPESAPYQRFLTFCEYATYAVFLAGWLGAILVQL